jgi:hypothetical protein
MAYPYTTPNSFDNGETIIAAEHNENWNSVQTYVNGLSSGDNFVAGAIGTIILANNSVTNDKIAGSAVITAKIADSAVTTVKIADANVTTAKIADSNVTTAKIADSNVTEGKLADGAVTSAKIADGAIVNADINASAGIVDTKLATITSSGKVANSATTATSSNTGSAIVARDSSGNFSAGTITATLSGNATSATSATSASSATLASKASTLAQGGGNGTAMTFNWSGQSGQPTWLWGSNDGTNHYVWNPSNFSVNYATSAGNADTLDGYDSGFTGAANLVMRTDGNGIAAAIKYGMASGNSYWNGSDYGGTILFRVNGANNIYYNQISASPRTMICNNDGTMGTSSSSIRFKENLRPYIDAENKVLELQPYIFDYKLETQEEDCSDPTARLNQFGMIAEHFHEAGLHHLVHYGKDGTIDSINYMMLSVELLGVVKNLDARLKVVEGR